MAYESRLSLTVDSRTGERNLKRLDGQLERTERRGQAASGAMMSVSRAVGLVAAAAGGLTFGRIIRETAGFEDSMLGLQAVSGATAEQMARLEKQARTLGATSMFSAQQAGDAQRFLAQAGLDANEVLSATPGILQLATAGQLDLARAADIASNVLGGMRLEVTELNRVNNVLAATASGSNTNIEQLGQALSFAAPFAASAGVSIEEAAAAIGVMSDAGIQASRAGTGLVGVIRQLSRVTPGAAEALAQAGLSVEDVNIEANGLQTVLDRLRRAGLTTGQAIEIFGSEAGAAAQVLFNGSERVAEFSSELGNADGEAERMAQTIGSGLTGSMRSFNSMLSESLIALGKDEGVASGFQAVIDSASGVLAVYNDMLPEFVEANDLTETQADNLELMAAGLKAAGAGALAIGGVTTALKAATVAQIAFNAAARANPYILAATAIAAAGAALWSFIDDMDETGARARALKKDIEGLTEEYGDLTEAQAINERHSLARQMRAAQEEARRLQREVEKVTDLVENSGQLNAQGGAMPVATAEDLARGRELNQQLKDTKYEAASLAGQYEEAGKRLEELRAIGGSDSSNNDEGGGSSSGNGKSRSQLDSPRSSPPPGGDSILGRIDAQARGDEIVAAQQREFEMVRQGLDRKYAIEQEHAQRMQALRDGQRLGLIENQEQMNALIVASTEQRNQELARIENERFQLMTQSQQQALGSLGEAFGNFAEIAKQGGKDSFDEYKAFASAQAAISASLAAIRALAEGGPFLGPVLAASIGALAAVQIANIQKQEYSGQAHDGIDSVPNTGTWNLEKGERVTGKALNRDLTQFLERENKERREPANTTAPAPVVNIHESPEKAGSVNSRRDEDGQWVIDVMVADAMGGGRFSRTNESVYGLRRQGR